MAKGIFTSKVEPEYDDLPEERYHFPRSYLNQVREVVGDWILYYEPRRSTGQDASRGGRQCYVATARVLRVRPDPHRDGHYYADVADYLPFATPVPFRMDGRFWEARLRKRDGSTNKGLFGRAVRTLADDEYAAILAAGFPDRRMREVAADDDEESFGLEGRNWQLTVSTRQFRERAFARVVRDAYDSTCALTGLRMINGGGRCEIEAAHVQPVASNGPDSPRNGIALSRTVHWAFDRGLLSMEDDGRILTVPRLLPEQFGHLLNRDGYGHMPEDASLRPHRRFLRFHRETVFKG